MKKRTDYIDWDEYFMGVAILSAKRSKDPGTQVGACIVTPDKKIVGVGYNGLPIGCCDEEFPWGREGDFLGTKYAYVCHAELNAILNSTKSLKGCTIYVDLFPCNECAKSIIQSGISEIVYLSDKYNETDSNKASKRLLSAANIKLRKLEPKFDELVLNFRKNG
nr:dCMP deaminase family protein [uncultured Cetobacterium sp.]